MPVLLKLVKDDDVFTHKIAADALKKIDPEAAKKAGIR